MHICRVPRDSFVRESADRRDFNALNVARVSRSSGGNRHVT